VPVDLTGQVVRAVRQACRDEGVTPFMFLLAAFAILLARHTGSQDILVGVPVANRPLPEVQRLVGFFVNTVVLRVDLAGAHSVRELLHRVRTAALGAYEHQNYPFLELVDDLQPERGLDRAALVSVTFGLQDEAWSQSEWSGLHMTPIPMPVDTVIGDLMLMLSESPDAFSGELIYHRDLFDPADVVPLSRQYQRIVEQISVRRDLPIDALVSDGHPSIPGEGTMTDA
jgi:non-ribosomal peptide synthetase component F